MSNWLKKTISLSLLGAFLKPPHLVVVVWLLVLACLSMVSKTILDGIILEREGKLVKTGFEDFFLTPIQSNLI